jgi:hypothetical protein
MDEIVSLEQAWFWHCPRCKNGNYTRSAPADMTDVPEEDVREMLDLEPWEALPDNVEDHFVTAPEFVQCAHCSATFPCFSRDEGSAGDEPEIPDGVPEDFGPEPG